MTQNRAFRALWLIPFATLVVAAAPAQPVGTLTIKVTNVRNTNGHVRVDICREKEFLGDKCPYHGASASVAGTTVVTVHGVPPGRYAIQAYHDENDNQDVDRAIFGIPKEGIGFSRDAPTSFGPPKWDRAEFEFNGHDSTTTLKMRYMLGKSGPGNKR